VIDTNTCLPIENAGVEIWHCDALGIYSHFEEASENVQNPQTDDTTYLRGIQLSDASGAVNFISIFPGWYNGRALHIHMKVHQNGTEGTVVHTGQLFFEEEINDEVAALEPYASHQVERMANDEDGIYNQGGYYGLITDWEMVSDDLADGVSAKISVGVEFAGGNNSSGSSNGASSGSSQSSSNSNTSSPNSSSSSSNTGISLRVCAFLVAVCLILLQ